MTSKEWKDKGNALVKEKNMESNLEKFEEALKDAEKAIEIKNDYGKGYLRKGTALKGLNKLEEALKAFKEGLEKDPNNQHLKDASTEIENLHKNPLLKKYEKLFTDPKTANLMKDVQLEK